MSYPFNPANLWTTSRYMQHSTYSHDFSQLGISPRQRPGDNVYNASVRADIPAGTYRPTMYDQMESPRREEAQQRYDYRGDLTERRIPKRGTEWIGGRRYDNEPREGRNDMYERQRRIDLSPERYDRGRNGSPERIDRGRNGSPERERKFEQVREPNDRHNRYIDKDKNRHIYPAWYDYPREPVRDKYDERYEKPRDQIMDGYANHKMSDRTTQKDYGEFMLEKIKQDEIRRNLDYPRQEAPAAQSGGVYLFIRTDKGALTEIRKALQEGRSVLANSGGQLKGIAHSEQIQILEGRLNEWNVKPSLDSNKEWDVLNIVAVFWFPTKYHTQQWLDSSHFKDLTFPFPYGADMSVAPINFIPKEGDIYGTTFLVSEYRDITDVDAFREKFIKPLRGIFKRLRIPDFVMNTIGADNFNRRAWMRKKSIVTVNRFEDSVAATNFFFDPEYVTLRTQLNDLIRWRTTVLFNLVEKPV